MSIPGGEKFIEQRNYRSGVNVMVSLDLVKFVNTSTPRDAVFASTMVVTPMVLAVTGRPIANHPHYEHTDIRNRTYFLYQVFVAWCSFR